MDLHPRGFLPHGTKDGYAERQPVWLTDSDENPNNANVLFLVDGAESSRIGEFDLCYEVFDGRDDRQSQAPAITEDLQGSGLI